MTAVKRFKKVDSYVDDQEARLQLAETTFRGLMSKGGCHPCIQVSVYGLALANYAASERSWIKRSRAS